MNVGLWLARRGPLVLLLAATACSPVADRAVVHDSPPAEVLVAGMTERLEFPIPPDVPPDIANGYRFAHGDHIVISVLGLDDTKRVDVLVDPDGNISYMHLRAVPAVGRTSEELANDLAAQLKDLYLDPVVAVRPDVVKGNAVFVVGEVRSPGTVPYERPLRILDAFALAGGLGTARVENRTRQVADLDHTTLLRAGKQIPLDFRALVIDGDLRHNITLHPGDIILVGSLVNAEIYILGAVRGPGSRKLTAGLTLMGALAKTGGFDQRAYRQSVAVLRGNMARPEIFVVDVDRILRAEALDFPLRAGDVIYVPDRPFNYARELAVVAMNAFVSVVAGRAGFEAYDHL